MLSHAIQFTNKTPIQPPANSLFQFLEGRDAVLTCWAQASTSSITFPQTIVNSISSSELL